jgi:hypothetical protein
VVLETILLDDVDAMSKSPEINIDVYLQPVIDEGALG